MNTPSWRGLIETKVLLIALIFGATASIVAEFQYWIQIWYFGNFNTSSLEKFSVYNLVLGGYSTLQGIPFFIALYYVAGRNFPTKASAILGSLIIGTILGKTLGGILGYVVLASIPIAHLNTPFGNPTILITQTLAYATGSWGMILSGLLPIFAAWGVREWDRRLNEAGLGQPSEKPSGLLIPVIAFGILGVLTFCFLPFLYFQPIVFPSVSMIPDLVLATVVISFLLVVTLVILLPSYGIYNGTRWGWIAAFTGAAILLIMNMDILVSVIIPQPSSTNAFTPTSFTTTLIIISALIAIACATLTLVILPQKRFRDFCRITGPPESSP